MTKPRIVETNVGIQAELTTRVFDQFARNMREKGWNNVDSILGAGISGGHALEIGPGPGYVGLEWLKRCPDAALTGCEISRNMIALAVKNAGDYGFSGRASYVEGSCMELPFPDSSFDAIFSNGSLHEWENPVQGFHEIHRVLKPGGHFCITDLRRDVNPLIKWMIYRSTQPKEIRPGFLSSLNAAYTAAELQILLEKSPLNQGIIHREFFGLCLAGQKAV